MSRDASDWDIPKIRPLGPLAAAGELVTDAWKAKKYIRINNRKQLDEYRN